MTSVALSVVQVALTTVAAWTLGRWTTGRLLSFPHPALRVAALITTGLLIWSHLTFGLAVIGFASVRTAGGLMILACALVFAEVIRLFRASLLTPSLLLRRISPRQAAVTGLSILYVAFLVAVAALPPTGVDELLYHLEAPRRFLESGHQPFFRDNILAYFPQFGEMLFLNGLALTGETGARLFHVLFALLLALAVYGYARERLTPFHAGLASGVLLTVPSFMLVAGSAYVDLMFSCFAFLALVALLKFLETGERVWILQAAIMAGGACSTKYTGIQLVMLLVLILLIQQLRSGAKGPWRLAPLFLPAVALLIASPYYLRNFILTGWPLFPFHIPWLPLSPEVNWDQERAKLLLRWLYGHGIGYQVTITDKLVAPLLVFLRARIGDPQAYDGFLGPVFLAVPPLLLVARGLVRRLGLLVLFAGLYIGYWTITTPQVRFLLPVIPVLALLLACGVAGLRSRPLTLVVVLLAVLNFAVGVRALIRPEPFGYWAGHESRDSYLARNVPMYPVYREMNQIVGPGQMVYMVAGYNHVYYLSCSWRADFVFTDYRFASVLGQARRPADILSFLRSQGATHLLLNYAVLSHPNAGLPDMDLRKLREFVGEYGREVYRRGEFQAFELRPGS